MPDEWWGPFAVWEGGLGIWGGIAGGILVGGYVAHRSGASVTALLDAAAPWASRRPGNRTRRQLVEPGAFRQADKPAVGPRDRPVRRPDEYLFDPTFHPTFLYEALWNLFAAAAAPDPRPSLPFRPPALFALYVALIHGFRFYLETLRIDPSHQIAGLRVNAWVSAVLFVLSVGFFVWWQLLGGGGGGGRRRRREPKAEPRPTMAVPRGRVRPRR